MLGSQARDPNASQALESVYGNLQTTHGVCVPGFARSHGQHAIWPAGVYTSCELYSTGNELAPLPIKKYPRICGKAMMAPLDSNPPKPHLSRTSRLLNVFIYTYTYSCLHKPDQHTTTHANMYRTDLGTCSQHLGQLG